MRTVAMVAVLGLFGFARAEVGGVVLDPTDVWVFEWGEPEPVKFFVLISANEDFDGKVVRITGARGRARVPEGKKRILLKIAGEAGLLFWKVVSREGEFESQTFIATILGYPAGEGDNTVKGVVLGVSPDGHREPLAGVEVVLKRRRGQIKKTQSAEDGSFQFASLSRGLYTLTAEKDGYRRARRRFFLPDGSELMLTLVLVPEELLVRNINGIVYTYPTGSSEREPVEGAEVSLLSDNQPVDEITTGESGSFRFTKLPSGNYVIVVDKEGFDTVDVAVELEERSVFIPIRLGQVEPGTLQGEVYYYDGGTLVPIEGAEVVLRSPFPGLERTTLTDRDGAYLLQNIEPGCYHLIVSKEGFSNARLKVIINPGETAERDIILKRYFASVGGVVFDREGPVAGAIVSLRSRLVPLSESIACREDDCVPPPSYETETDENGCFAFPEVLPGLYTLRVTKEGYKTYFRRLRVRIGRHIELKIKLKRRASGSLEGTVYSSRQGMLPVLTPIQGALVRLYSKRAFVSEGIELRPTAETETDESGYYAFDSLPVGVYFCVVTAEGYRPARKRVKVRPEEKAVRHFILRPLLSVGRLEGTVTEEDDTGSLVPIVGASLCLLPLAHPSEATPPPPLVLETETEENGRYTFESVLTGRYVCAVWVEGYDTVEQDVEIRAGETTTLDFHLSKAEESPEPAED